MIISTQSILQILLLTKPAFDWAIMIISIQSNQTDPAFD